MTEMKKLTADQARRLHAAEIRFAKAKLEFEGAKEDRDEVRARYLDRIPLSEKPDERAKGVRVCTVAGIKIRVTPQVSGDYFNLSGYRSAGHVVTMAMGAHITEGKPYDRWTVSGPPKSADAVEPRP